MATPILQYFESAQVAGLAGEDFTVCAATGRALGRLRGLIVDPLNQHLRYLVVRTVGWFGMTTTTLVPAASPRIDDDRHAIQIDVEDNELRLLHDLTLEKALDSGVCVRAGDRLLHAS